MTASTVTASTSSAQTPAAPAPYHTPVVTLAQPSDGGSVPVDRPVVVLGFAAGELADPVDAHSLVVTVDGVDRTALFQVTTDQAWGPIAPANTVVPGSHELQARICSTRGLCTALKATVLVAATGAHDANSTNASAQQRKGHVLDLLIQAARTLLKW